MSSTPTVSISRNDIGGWNITHDGHDIAWAINARPAPTLSLDLDVPVLTADLAVGDLEVDGATLELRVPGHVRDALVAAGWTAPKEENR